jgi:hypothetical protein
MSTEVQKGAQNSGPALAKVSQAEPVFIDLGKRKKKQIRQLRRGRPGRLMDKVQSVLEQLKEGGALTAAAQPVIVVIREKRRRARGMFR